MSGTHGGKKAWAPIKLESQMVVCCKWMLRFETGPLRRASSDDPAILRISPFEKLTKLLFKWKGFY